MDVGDVVSRVDRRALVRDERLQAVRRRELRRPSRSAACAWLLLVACGVLASIVGVREEPLDCALGVAAL